MTDYRLTEAQKVAYNQMWESLHTVIEQLDYKRKNSEKYDFHKCYDNTSGEWLIDNDRMNWNFQERLYDGTQQNKLDITFFKDNCWAGSSVGYEVWSIKGYFTQDGRITHRRLDQFKEKLDKFFNENGED